MHRHAALRIVERTSCSSERLEHDAARKIEVSRLRCVCTCRRQVRACRASRACASV